MLHQEVDTFVAALTADYVVVLELFLRAVAGTDLRKLFTALKEGPLPLSQVITTLDMSKTDFANLVASLPPHPFLIKVETEHICLNAVVETAIDEEALLQKVKK